MEKQRKEIPLRIEPVIDVAGCVRKVCSLNFKVKDQEFFYQFAFPRGANLKLWNFTLREKTGRPDHITFHKDGSVRLRLKGDNKKLPSGHAPDGAFISTNPNIITPLLIHSIYSVDGEYYLPLCSGETIYKNRLASVVPFSIILFLTPVKFSVDQFLNKFWLDTDYGKVYGSLLGSPAGRIEAWDGWAIDYVLSDLTLLLPNNIQPNSYHCVFAYRDLHLVFRDLLAQRLV